MADSFLPLNIPSMRSVTRKPPTTLSVPKISATNAMVVVIGAQVYQSARVDYGMDKAEAAFLLGLSRSTLWRKINQLGLG